MARIYLFIRAHTSPMAQIWFTGLERAVLSLSEIPERCPVTAESSSHRQLLYGNKPHVYRIIFKIDEVRKTVWIKTVRHGFRLPVTL
jgi:hypothetical protein